MKAKKYIKELPKKLREEVYSFFISRDQWDLNEWYIVDTAKLIFNNAILIKGIDLSEALYKHTVEGGAE